MTNKTSQRLKEKASLILFLVLFCQCIQLLESNLLKMENFTFLYNLKKYIYTILIKKKIGAVRLNHIYVRPFVNIILGET